MPAGQDDGQRSDVVRVVPRQGADVHEHEHVIEQLGAVRLTLRGVEGGLNGGPLASRLRDAIAELDDATQQLRAPAPGRLVEAPTGDAGLAARLLEVVREASLRLDSAPGLQFSGMDVALPDDVMLLNLMPSWAPDEKLRHRILVENPETFYGFDPKKRPKAI